MVVANKTNKTEYVFTGDQEKLADEILVVMDQVVRSFGDTDSTKVRQFQYKSKILEDNLTDFTQSATRIKIPLESGLAWFVIDKISDDTVLDGWETVYDKNRVYTDKEKETIRKRETRIRESLKELKGEDERTNQSKVVQIRRRDGWGAVVPSFSTSTTFDQIGTNKEKEEILASPAYQSRKKIGKYKTYTRDQILTHGELKRLQIYAPHQVRLQNSDLDNFGNPVTVTIRVPMANGTKEVKLDVEKDGVIFFKGRHIDNKSSWIGQSVLQPNLAYIIMLEWTAYSGADYANNRGSFLWMKRLLPNTSNEKLQSMYNKLMYIFTRNALVTGDSYDVKQMSAGGSAVPIDSIMDKLYQLLGTGTAIPESKLKGAQQGQVTAAKEDRISYYPVLRHEQNFLIPVWRKVIELIDPAYFTEFNLDIEFRLEVNLSAAERIELNLKELSYVQSHVSLLIQFHYSIDEIINIIENPELLPRFEIESDPRGLLILANIQQPDFSIAAPEFMGNEMENIAVNEALARADSKQLVAAMINKKKATIDEFTAGVGTTKAVVSKFLRYVGSER